MKRVNSIDKSGYDSQSLSREINPKSKVDKYCLYAPVDGMIYSITKLNDGVFSEKTLGDGIYLIPSSPSFFAPLDNAVVSLIAKTKHAFGFKVGKINVLLHIGIDSVNLNGEPFQVLVNQGDHLEHTTPIANVNLDLLREKKISLATPLILERSDDHQYQFVFDQKLDGQKVKHGQLIGYIQLAAENRQTKAPPIDITGYVNQFETAAQTIYHAVGKNNFSDYANCMTRFRMQINDKNAVNEAEIKKIPLVKGIHWNGAQLQIIIGGDVVKVTDCFRKYLEQLNTVPDQRPAKTLGKVPISKKLLAIITSIIFPILPVLIAGGVLKAFYAIFITLEKGKASDNIFLTLSGLSNTYLSGGGKGVDISVASHVNPTSYVFFVLGDLPFLFLALFFLISVIKRFKGDTLIGTAIGLTLSAPLIYTICFPYDYAHFLSWSIFQYPGFKISNSIDANNPIVVSPISVGVVNLSQNIFVMVGTGLFYVWFDRWVKTWMPAVIDLFARPALCLLVTVTLSLTLFNIVMSLIQYILQIVVVFLTAIPFGLGGFLFALLWQPLVITGAHAPIAFALIIPLLGPDHIPSNFMWGMQLAALAQAGAGFANGCLSKNAATRTAAFNTAPVAVLGITEPIMYGVNLFKFKSFLYACLGSGIAGWFCGLTNVRVVNAGALGILALPSLIPIVGIPSQAGINAAENIGFGALGLVIAFATSFVFVFIFCREYVSTNKQFSQISRLLKRSLIKWNKKTVHKIGQTDINNFVYQANQLTTLTKQNQVRLLLRQYKDYVTKLSKIDRRLDLLNKKEDQLKLKLSKKAKYYQKRDDETKLSQIKQKFMSVNFETDRQLLLKQREKLVNENQNLQNQYDDFKNGCLAKTNQFVEKLKALHVAPLEKLSDNYFNAINVIDITFDLIASKENPYKQRELKKWLDQEQNLKVVLKN